MLFKRCTITLGLIFYVASIFCSMNATDNSNKNIYENDDDVSQQSTQNFIVIPLGCHCGVAWWMREYNIRLFALPFDWCITPYQALYKTIESDFCHYFKKENLVPSSKAYWSDYLYNFYKNVYHTNVDGSIGAVLDKKFQMIFAHDFPNNMHATINHNYDIQYTKYSRRIKRFFEVINSGKHIYFMRLHDITKKEALALYQLLKTKYPTTPFTLIALGSDSQEFSQDWGLPEIKNIFISEETVNVTSLGTVFWQELVRNLVNESFL